MMFWLPFSGLSMFLGLPRRATALALVARLRLTYVQPSKSESDSHVTVVRFGTVGACWLSTCIPLASPLLAITFFACRIGFVFSFSTPTIRVAAIVRSMSLGTWNRTSRQAYARLAAVTLFFRIGQSGDQARCLASGVAHAAHRCFARSSFFRHMLVLCPCPLQKPHLAISLQVRLVYLYLKHLKHQVT